MAGAKNFPSRAKRRLERGRVHYKGGMGSGLFIEEHSPGESLRTFIELSSGRHKPKSGVSPFSNLSYIKVYMDCLALRFQTDTRIETCWRRTAGFVHLFQNFFNGHRKKIVTHQFLLLKTDYCLLFISTFCIMTSCCLVQFRSGRMANQVPS